jgi:CubicO group peptidase (beta-lactamase class C family)
VIESVTGITFERAIASPVLEPLCLSHSFFGRDEIMTRRFAVGHKPGDGGALEVAHPWKHWRADNPGAGLASSVADQFAGPAFILVTARSTATPLLCPHSSCGG